MSRSLIRVLPSVTLVKIPCGLVVNSFMIIRLLIIRLVRFGSFLSSIISSRTYKTVVEYD